MWYNKAMRKLKVYGWNHCGTQRRICAATSWKRVRELEGNTRSIASYLDYGSVTGNEAELKLALSKPETIFECSHNDYELNYKEVV